MSFYDPLPPPPLHDDHGRPLKPSERFARPNGPVFLVDEKGYNNHPAFSYSYKQDSNSPSYSLSSEQSSPFSTWSNGQIAGGAVTDSPATSSEGHGFGPGQPSAFDKHHGRMQIAPPPPPPKLAQLLDQSYEREQEQQQESRDQLSPLISPRKLGLGHSNQSNSLDAFKDDTIVKEEEYDVVKTPKSPSKGRSFFTFGKSGTGKNTTPRLQVDIPKLDAPHGDRKGSKTSRHGRRNSAEDTVPAHHPHQHPPSSTERHQWASPESIYSQSAPSEAQKTMNLQDIMNGNRAGRSMTSGIVASLNRRSRSASKSSAAAPLTPTGSEGSPDSKWRKNPYENKQVQNGNGIHSALQENWVSVPQYHDGQVIQGKTSQDGSGRIHDFSQKIPLPPLLPAKQQQSPERRKQATPPVPAKPVQQDSPKTPSPIKSRHKVSSNWRKTPASPSINTPPSPTSSSLATSPSKENSKSPTFFMRGRQALKNVNPSNRGISSGDSQSPSAKGRQSSFGPFSPPASPPSTVESAPARTAAAWPAESHVFGAAQAVIGNATIGPHVPEVRKSTFQPVVVKPSTVPSIVSPHPQDHHDGNNTKDNLQRNETPSTISTNDNDVFTETVREYSQDPRKRVMDLLNIPQSRKSSLYTSSSASFRTSGTSTPVPKRYSKGHPRLDEALLVYPETILASILDHVSFRSFKRLLHSSPGLYRAAYNDETGQSDLMEVVKQRYLASYGYRPLPRSSNMQKDKIKFTIKDLNAFQIGTEYSLSEYSIFATEHKRKPLDTKITRILRESTRSFNKLAFRLQAQANYSSTLSHRSNVEEGLKLIKPYWQNYKKIDYQNQLFKKGRCMLLRVWIPCETQWMTDLEVVEVEREVHRSGVWGLLKRGDLVRNIALGDIANEGILIFDGKYLRDLSYAHDTIGHLPSWLNSLTFSPSYFHNQIASSTLQPIVYLDLTQYHSAIQANLMLCREKVDISSPSGEQYKVTRYVYRTAIELNPSSMSSDPGAGESDFIHPDWAGQLIIETDGTTEAAKDLLQRVTAPSKDSGVSNPPSEQSNNRPYMILRNLSTPGLIFCRVVPDNGSGQ